MNNDIVIVAAQRTPMGGLQGSLSSVPAPQLGAAAIESCLNKSGIEANAIDEVYMGCVLSAGLGQAPARQAALAAGLGEQVPCTTINKVCGSGMKSVMLAADQIKVGNANVVVAGGMESMSSAPYMLDKARGGYRMGHGQIYDHMFLDGLQDAYDKEAMGLHAQTTADDYGITREAMDEFALRSLSRAQQAIEKNWFVEEIAAVTVKNRKGDTQVTIDEQPGLAKPEKIPGLRPAFTQDGTITAANASSISDGASALIVTHKDKADALGLKPLARIIDYASHAQKPSTFTCAPIGAINTIFARQNITANDIDLAEINEAFAMVPMLAMQELGFTPEQVNIAGGACALGHPLGSSGSRIIVTLLYNLIRNNKKRGLAALCIGGGEGTAMLIERI
ncbi:MAG: thiolase family protein [Cellvibrionaceae bacterium]